jgi:hypothetical protein
MPMICIRFSGVSGSIDPPASRRWMTSAWGWVEGGMGVEVRVGMAVFYRVRVKGNCFIGGAGETLVQSGLLLAADSSKY